MKLLIFISLFAFCLGSTCKQKSGKGKQCQCETSEGFVFDLGEFSSALGLKAQNNTDKNTYDINPCKGFSTSDACDGAAVCQHTSTETLNAGDIPVPNKNIFSGDPHKDTLKVTYTHGTRTSILKVLCSNSEKHKYKAIGETSKLNYEFHLETSRVCAPKKKESSGLSVGSVLCILLLVVIIVYLVGGFLFLRFARGARGIEQVPNLAFWRELPLLIWDGIVFLKNGCKTDSTYDQI